MIDFSYVVVEIKCPLGFVHDPTQKGCFGVHFKKLDFDNAEAQCQSYGGHLASFHSNESVTFLQSLMFLFVYLKFLRTKLAEKPQCLK